MINSHIQENLNNWNELCCLTQEQLNSVDILGAYDLENDGLDSNLVHNDLKNAVVEAMSKDKITENINELLYNFAIDDLEDVNLKEYVYNLEEYKTKCDNLHGIVSNTIELLNMLKDNYQQVSLKTNSLHNACEQILNDQTKLVNTLDLVGNKLSYFTEVDVLAQKINSPLIENNYEYIIPILSRIDECMIFFKTNKSYKESESYMKTLKEFLNKALTIIKNQINNSLIQITDSIMIQLSESTEEITFSADNSYTYFYTKFRTNSHRIRTLIEQLEQRLDTHLNEYDEALLECHQYYTSKRRVLMSVPIQNAINDLALKNRRDTCTLVRSSFSFMFNLCQDEYKLFMQFFSKPSVVLATLLDEFCMRLYDVLRPIVIHVVHIETLAELCSILKNEILGEKNLNKENKHELEAFEQVCTQLLEDVQERFVYRTHIYLKDEIRDYNPSSGDLAYPEKLEIMVKIASSLSTSSSDSSPADIHGLWYPTVKRSLICLSKLYRCLDRPIFEGLSQEILSMCVHSLCVASDRLSKLKTQRDSQLFLIKHLLILREQIAPFNVEFSIKEMQLDFTRIRDAAYNLFYKRDSYFKLNFDNAFLDFLLHGTLEAKENFVDSKRDVDSHLKVSCESFISNSTNDLMSSIKHWLDKAQKIIQINQNESTKALSLSTQTFAKANTLHDLIAENLRDLKQKLPKLQYSMSVYLANKDIEQIIYRRIKSNIQSVYQELQDIVLVEYNEEDKLIIACPTHEQISLLTTNFIEAIGLKLV